MNRTPKNALFAISGCYLGFTLVAVLVSGLTAGALVLPLVPALLVGLVISGYLEVIRTRDGFRIVDARRSAASKQAAAKTGTLDAAPQFNVNGLKMTNGVDANGNAYGSTANDPKLYD